MANKDLKDRYFIVPTELKEYLSGVNEVYNENSGNRGEKRLMDILENGKISYPQMKRIKNFFDTYEGNVNDKEFIMNGGERMKNWVSNALKIARDAIYAPKKAMMDAGMENQFIEPHDKNKNANPTNVRMPRLDKGNSGNIMRGDAVYESEQKIKHLINYFNKNK